MKNLRALSAFLVALPLTVLLSGCPLYSGDGDPSACRDDFDCSPSDRCMRGSCVPSGPDCVSSDDCFATEVCSAGACVPGSRCTGDSDCATGELCDAGACVPGTASCRTHGDCAAGAYCDSGACTPSGSCGSDTDCAGFTDFWCDFRDTCVPSDPGACRTGSDCATGELCIEARCTPIDETCQFDRECSPGTLCVNDECTRVCTGDTDCASGDSCQGGFCRGDGTECTRSNTCGAGENCVDGRCLGDCTGGGACETGTYCGGDMFCRPTWQPEDFCTSDTQCNMGRVCREGVCRTPCGGCTTDASCGAGAPAGTCDVATGSCGNWTCMNFDSQVPQCRFDATSTEYLCHATNELTPECRVAADCGADRDCVDGACRNRR